MSAVLKEAVPHWPDGTRKSMNNGFRLGFKGVDHGFDPAAPAKRYESGKPVKDASTSRSPKAFGTVDGVIPNMGANG